MAFDVVELVAETTFNQFQGKMREKPLVLIYPRNRARNALLAMFLQYYQENVIYYNLGSEDTNLKSWLKNFVDDMIFPGSFGDQTRAALKSKAEPEELAAAFASDLAQLRSEQFVIVLDSFDQLESSETLNRFLRALPAVMPSHAQLVISARLLDLQPWNDLILSGQAGVVGDDEALSGSIYGDEPRRGQLEVYALSGGYVYIDGKPVLSWDGSLPKHLFYYFVDHPMITRDEIFSVFWPNMSIKEATNVFHVTKRKISERLGYELTNYTGGFYVPSTRLSVHYDAKVFETAAQNAIEHENEAARYWYEAIQVYRSDFLPDIHTAWINSRREELRHRYTQALIALGRYHRGLGELDRALGYLVRALREKPDWEDVHRDVMLIYYQQGKREAAVDQYNQLANTLQSMFKIQPSRDTRNLLEVITAV